MSDSLGVVNEVEFKELTGCAHGRLSRVRVTLDIQFEYDRGK
jgi:hypothetical protein